MSLGTSGGILQGGVMVGATGGGSGGGSRSTGPTGGLALGGGAPPPGGPLGGPPGGGGGPAGGALGTGVLQLLAGQAGAVRPPQGALKGHALEIFDGNRANAQKFI